MSTWYELVVEGAEYALEDFLAGDAGHEVIRGSDLHLGSLADRILDLLNAKTHHLLLAPDARAQRLIRSLEERTDLRLEAVREVTGGHFSFKAKAYNREVAAEIQGDLRSLPAGVVLEDVEESEETDPEAAGVELRAQAHEYVYRAKGTLRGTLPGVAEMHRRLRKQEFCEPEALHLDVREVTPPSRGA